jgi:predicted Zn-dependent protease/fructose-1,6-bisphosphatase/inositol monophosphatase family enzyme
MTSFARSVNRFSAEDLPVLEQISYNVARELARLGMDYYTREAPHVEFKRDLSLVSEADLAIEDKARELLARHTPDFGFVGEERPSLKHLGEGVLPQHVSLNEPVPDCLSRDTDTYWLLDPIDGTLNFLERVPLWSTLLALIHKGEPVLSVVMFPALGEVFVASKGRGARFGELTLPISELRSCSVREGFYFENAILNSAPLNAYAARGVELWFLHLQRRLGRTRVQGDAFGYTRVLMGVVDGMIDPMVCDHDVAALQLLFQETPGAFFSTLHGHTGARAYTRGSVVAAASPALGRQILSDYWSHLAATPEPLCALKDTLEAPRYSDILDEREAWLFSIEKAVAVFKQSNFEECVEDLSFVFEQNHVLRCRVKNGASDEPAQVERLAGVQVRAVVAGGVGLATSSWPLLQSKVNFIASALNLALSQSREQNRLPTTEVLAIRPKASGHFGNILFGALPSVVNFRNAVESISLQQTPSGIDYVRVVQTTVEQVSNHRFQLFLDGVRQTVSQGSTLVRVSATAERDSEKRQGFRRYFASGFLTPNALVEAHGEALHRAVQEARELVDAEYVPENISYDYLAIDADLLGLILHEALGHAVEGDFIEQGSSGLSLKGRLREVDVAPEWMSVVIDGALENCGYAPVDYEGTPAIRKTIVREGKLVEAIHTRQSAYALGHVPDGAARAESVLMPSMNRMTSIWVQAKELRPVGVTHSGEHSDFLHPEDLQNALLKAGFLKSGAKVLYLTGWKGGTATCSNLEFRADVRKIYEIREGEKPVLMRSANFTGIATACFQSALAAFGQVMCHTYGICGKDGQSVPTSDGGPMVLLLGKHENVHVIGAGDEE